MYYGRHKIFLIMLIGVVFIVTGSPVKAQDKPAENSGNLSSWDQWWRDFHNPTDYLEMGFDHRFRTITARNIDTLDTDATQNKWNYQRYRFRWWAKWLMNEDVDFNARLVWEFRTWDEPKRKPQHTDFDEILFDRFNFTMRNVFDMPLTAVIGRQDIIFGVGWLVLDGTPLDGSRTIFTDAVRFTYDWKEKDTKIDMIYIDQASASDRWLKPVNDRDRGLTEQDEYGAILYLTNQSLEKTKLEAYFMYKNDNPIDILPGDRNFPGLWSRKAEIYTFGGAVAKTIDDNWNYRVEGAIQTGDKSDATADLSTGTMRDLEAYGALTNLEYLFHDNLDSSAHIGYEYCSGDDPGTSDNEQFDPLWAEWPRWSELYIYTYSKETMIAESTNVHRFNVGHKFKANKQWQICTDYHLLWADQNTTTGSATFVISDHSNFRGQLLTCWAKYKMSEKLSGHLLGEYFIPGSYYDQSNRDAAFFLRFNLEYKF